MMGMLRLLSKRGRPFEPTPNREWMPYDSRPPMEHRQPTLLSKCHKELRKENNAALGGHPPLP